MRNHGLVDRNTVDQFGFVSRMDSIQAAILRYRLKVLPRVIKQRKKNVTLYRKLLGDNYVLHPQDKFGQDNSWHTFVIQVDQRDELQAYLSSKGIETAIHYPVPIHLQPAARPFGYKRGDFPMAEVQAKRILTLPVHQYLDEEKVEKIANCVNQFYES